MQRAHRHGANIELDLKRVCRRPFIDARGVVTVLVAFFKAGMPVGEGVLWMADGKAAKRLRGIEPVEEISLEEARATAERLGLPLPSK